MHGCDEHYDAAFLDQTTTQELGSLRTLGWEFAEEYPVSGRSDWDGRFSNARIRYVERLLEGFWRFWRAGASRIDAEFPEFHRRGCWIRFTPQLTRPISPRSDSRVCKPDPQGRITGQEGTLPRGHAFAKPGDRSVTIRLADGHTRRYRICNRCGSPMCDGSIVNPHGLDVLAGPVVRRQRDRACTFDS